MSEETEGLLAEYLRLTREVLPGRAASEGWVIRADHCFGRILLDHVFGGAWYEHLAGRTPACRQLTADQLRRAVHMARDVEREGDPLLRRLNADSLRWRGKAGRQR